MSLPYRTPAEMPAEMPYRTPSKIATDIHASPKKPRRSLPRWFIPVAFFVASPIGVGASYELAKRTSFIELAHGFALAWGLVGATAFVAAVDIALNGPKRDPNEKS